MNIRFYWDGELDPFCEFYMEAPESALPRVGTTMQVRDTVQTVGLVNKEVVTPAVVLAVQPELVHRPPGHMFGPADPHWQYALHVTLGHPEAEKRYG